MPLHAAEVLLALPFVVGGLSTLARPQERANQIARVGFPCPLLAVRTNAVVMIAAGAVLAFNVRPALSSGLLALVLVPTTVFGHAFWVEAGVARQHQLTHFFKNLAILGGLIAISLVA